MMRVRPRAGRHLLTAVLLMSLAGCAGRQPGDPLEPGFNIYSPDQDVEIGRRAAAEIEQQVELVQNRQLQDYISDLGNSLASNPAAGPYPYSFKLVNDSAVNAFALPGGPIYVNSGLLEAAESEAHLAGVLAHEIAHVGLRHGTSQASKSSLAQIPAVLAGTVIGDESTLAQVGQLGLGFGLNSLFLKYSRTAEQEADALGARLMARAGYDPLQMARFFEVLEAEGGGARPPQFLSSHPDPGNRVAAVRAEVETFEPGSYGTRTGRFDDAKQAAARLPEPSPEPTEYALGGDLPQPGDFERLDSGLYTVEYPGNWRVYGGDSSEVITVAPPEGLVGSRGGVSLGYGAVFSHLPMATGELRGLTGELISELRSVNRGLEFVSGPRDVMVGGDAGLLSVLSGPSPYGGQERDILVTVRRPNGLFYAVFVAPEEGFDRVEPIFDRMFRSIQF